LGAVSVDFVILVSSERLATGIYPIDREYRGVYTYNP